MQEREHFGSDHLLLGHMPRSDDTDSSHSQDIEVNGDSCPPPNCFTGAFYDRAHETCFQTGCFQTAYPMHIGLMTLKLIADAWFAASRLSITESSVLQAAASRAGLTTFAVSGDLAVILGRVGLHRMINIAAAQRVGGIGWTCYVLLCVSYYFLVLSTPKK